MGRLTYSRTTTDSDGRGGLVTLPAAPPTVPPADRSRHRPGGHARRPHRLEDRGDGHQVASARVRRPAGRHRHDAPCRHVRGLDEAGRGGSRGRLDMLVGRPARRLGRLPRSAVVDRDGPAFECRPDVTRPAATGRSRSRGREVVARWSSSRNRPSYDSVGMAPASRRGPRLPGAPPACGRAHSSRGGRPRPCGSCGSCRRRGGGGNMPSTGGRRPGSCRSGDSATCPRAEV